MNFFSLETVLEVAILSPTVLSSKMISTVELIEYPRRPLPRLVRAEDLRDTSSPLGLSFSVHRPRSRDLTQDFANSILSSDITPLYPFGMFTGIVECIGCEPALSFPMQTSPMLHG